MMDPPPPPPPPPPEVIPVETLMETTSTTSPPPPPPPHDEDKQPMEAEGGSTSYGQERTDQQLGGKSKRERKPSSKIMESMNPLESSSSSLVIKIPYSSLGGSPTNAGEKKTLTSNGNSGIGGLLQSSYASSNSTSAPPPLPTTATTILSSSSSLSILPKKTKIPVSSKQPIITSGSKRERVVDGIPEYESFNYEPILNSLEQSTASTADGEEIVANTSLSSMTITRDPPNTAAIATVVGGVASKTKRVSNKKLNFSSLMNDSEDEEEGIVKPPRKKQQQRKDPKNLVMDEHGNLVVASKQPRRQNAKHTVPVINSIPSATAIAAAAAAAVAAANNSGAGIKVRRTQRDVRGAMNKWDTKVRVVLSYSIRELVEFSAIVWRLFRENPKPLNWDLVCFALTRSQVLQNSSMLSLNVTQLRNLWNMIHLTRSSPPSDDADADKMLSVEEAMNHDHTSLLFGPNTAGWYDKNFWEDTPLSLSHKIFQAKALLGPLAPIGNGGNFAPQLSSRSKSKTTRILAQKQQQQQQYDRGNNNSNHFDDDDDDDGGGDDDNDGNDDADMDPGKYDNDYENDHDLERSQKKSIDSMNSNNQDNEIDNS